MPHHHYRIHWPYHRLRPDDEPRRGLLGNEGPTDVDMRRRNTVVVVVVKDYYAIISSSNYPWSVFVEDYLPKYLLFCKLFAPSFITSVQYII